MATISRDLQEQWRLQIFDLRWEAKQAWLAGLSAKSKHLNTKADRLDTELRSAVEKTTNA